MRVNLDEAEMEAVISFQEAMIESAEESCEYLEAKARRERVEELRKILAAFYKGIRGGRSNV